MEQKNPKTDHATVSHDIYSPDRYKLKSASVILTKLDTDEISKGVKSNIQCSSKHTGPHICWENKDISGSKRQDTLVQKTGYDKCKDSTETDSQHVYTSIKAKSKTDGHVTVDPQISTPRDELNNVNIASNRRNEIPAKCSTSPKKPYAVEYGTRDMIGTDLKVTTKQTVQGHRLLNIDKQCSGCFQNIDTKPTLEKEKIKSEENESYSSLKEMKVCPSISRIKSNKSKIKADKHVTCLDSKTTQRTVIVQPDFDIERKNVIIKTEISSPSTETKTRKTKLTKEKEMEKQVNEIKKEEDQMIITFGEKSCDKDKGTVTDKYKWDNKTDVPNQSNCRKYERNPRCSSEASNTVKVKSPYLCDQTLHLNNSRKISQKNKRTNDPYLNRSSKRKCNNVTKYDITVKNEPIEEMQEHCEDVEVKKGFSGRNEIAQSTQPKYEDNKIACITENGLDKYGAAIDKEHNLRNLPVVKDKTSTANFEKCTIKQEIQLAQESNLLVNKSECNDYSKSSPMEGNKVATIKKHDPQSSRISGTQQKQRTIPTILSRSRKPELGKWAEAPSSICSSPCTSRSLSHPVSPSKLQQREKLLENLDATKEGKYGHQTDMNAKYKDKNKHVNKQPQASIKTQNFSSLPNYSLYNRLYPTQLPTWSQFRSMYYQSNGYDPASSQSLYSYYNEMCHSYYKNINLMYSPYNSVMPNRYHDNRAYYSDSRKEQPGSNQSPLAAMQMQVNRIKGYYGQNRWIPYHNQQADQHTLMSCTQKTFTSRFPPPNAATPSKSCSLSSPKQSKLMPSYFKKDGFAPTNSKKCFLSKSGIKQDKKHKIDTQTSTQISVQGASIVLGKFPVDQKLNNANMKVCNSLDKGSGFKELQKPVTPCSTEQSAYPVRCESTAATFNLNQDNTFSLSTPVACDGKNSSLVTTTNPINKAFITRVQGIKELTSEDIVSPSAKMATNVDKVEMHENHFKENKHTKDKYSTKQRKEISEELKSFESNLQKKSDSGSFVTDDIDILHLSDHAYTKTPDSSPYKPIRMNSQNKLQDNFQVSNNMDQKIPVYAVPCGNKLLLFSPNKRDITHNSPNKPKPVNAQIKDSSCEKKKISSFIAKKKRLAKQIRKKPAFKRLSRKRFAKHLNLTPAQSDCVTITNETNRRDAGDTTDSYPQHMCAVCICIDKNDANSLTYTINKVAITYKNTTGHLSHQPSYHVRLTYDVNLHALKHLEAESLIPGFYNKMETTLVDRQGDKSVEIATLIPYPADIDALPIASSWIAIGEIHSIFDPFVQTIPAGDLQSLMTTILPKDSLCYGSMNISCENYRPKKDARIWYARQYFDFFTKKYCRLKRSMTTLTNKEKVD